MRDGRRGEESEVRRDNDAAGVWTPENCGKSAFVSRGRDHVTTIFADQVNGSGSRNVPRIDEWLHRLLSLLCFQPVHQPVCHSRVNVCVTQLLAGTQMFGILWRTQQTHGWTLCVYQLPWELMPVLLISHHSPLCQMLPRPVMRSL